MKISAENILKLLSEINDPEIPVLNIVEMGIVRDVCFEEGKIIIDITPTYSGCPAMKTIEDEIETVLKQNEYSNIEINTVYSPAWTTDWLNEHAKEKLIQYGISPPAKTENINFLNSLYLQKIKCPYCSSANTKLTSEFGSTACKSLHFCEECSQPFEHFKCI